jgi:predicted ferric reductase
VTSRRPITEVLAYIITAVWVVSFIVDIVNPEYEPHPSVHAIMTLVAGALFGESVFRRGNNRDETVKEKEVGGG